VSVFESVTQRGHEQVVYCYDATVGLKAIIAIHDTTLGPALGGCRFWNYGTEQEALDDVLRLSRGMTYKAAVAGLHLGGGKAVIIGDPKKLKSEAFFRTFGRFVDSLHGRYITAEDVNINVDDVEYISQETKFVSGVRGGSGDPSPITALGTYAGIKAAVEHKMGKKSLNGLKVSLQGCGAVGQHLCELLSQDGVRLFVSDIDEEKVRTCVESYRAEAVDPKKIHALDVDVFAPCALGAVLNDQTIPEIKARIVAGAANNQLKNEETHGMMLQDRQILYAPDYVINAGGLINVYHELKGYNAEAAKKAARGIHGTLLEIFNIAEKSGIPTQVASNHVAEKRINSVKTMRGLKNYLGSQVWAK
jgi:leucine dehydrogenase